MNLISYNVNGIRAAFGKNFIEWLSFASPDILCIQEIKATKEQIDVQAIRAMGYHDYWFSAQKKGYSGVGILSKQKPKHVEYGCGIEKYDAEGRVIRADFDDYSVISVYVPSASNLERLEFKMEFCYDFLRYIKSLQNDFPKLIISGDFNICHQEIDIHDPKIKNVSGVLPIEREWMSRFMEECSLTDAFRCLNPEMKKFSWWSYRQNSRSRDKGWRLDYNFLTSPVCEYLRRAVILTDVVHSDHCPVLVEVEI